MGDHLDRRIGRRAHLAPDGLADLWPAPDRAWGLFAYLAGALHPNGYYGDPSAPPKVAIVILVICGLLVWMVAGRAKGK
jgi:hypothetical protein